MANPGVITKNFVLEAGDIDNNDPYPMYFRGFIDPRSHPESHTLRSLQIILSDGSGAKDVVKVNIHETGRDPQGADLDPTLLDALPDEDWSDTSTDWFEGATEIDNSAGPISLMIHDDAHFTARWIRVTITRTGGSADDAEAEIIDIEEVS